MSFDYNSSGLRTKKVVGDKTIEYYYSGDLLVAQFDGTYWVRFIYAPNGEAVGFTYGEFFDDNQSVDYDYCYYVKNIQGDIVGFYSMFVDIIREYTYDAWGNITGVYDEDGDPVTDTNDVAYLNPLRYRGYYYDDETGLYYLNSRYYNPEWGTFISADGYVSTGQGLIGYNMYAYCLNNPINYSDPNGNLSQNDKLAIRIATVFACLAYIADHAQRNHKSITAFGDFLDRTIGDDASLVHVANTLTVGVYILHYGNIFDTPSDEVGIASDLLKFAGVRIPEIIGNSATAVGLLTNVLADIYNPLMSNNELTKRLVGHAMDVAAGVGIATFSAELAAATTAISGNPAVGITLGALFYIGATVIWDDTF